jgi:hypothetical protein
MLNFQSCDIWNTNKMLYFQANDIWNTDGILYFEAGDIGNTNEMLYFQTGDIWNTDECTSCQCMNGVVNCSSTLCPALDCGSDNIPAILPGSCCPVCTPSK